MVDDRGDADAPASDHGVYGISVAAELSGIAVQSLRLYERYGLLTPSRSDGGTRRYSADDLARLQAHQRVGRRRRQPRRRRAHPGSRRPQRHVVGGQHRSSVNQPHLARHRENGEVRRAGHSLRPSRIAQTEVGYSSRYAFKEKRWVS